MVFPPGFGTVQRIHIPILNDECLEPDLESFFIVLSSNRSHVIVGSMNETEVYIQDDDCKLPEHIFWSGGGGGGGVHTSPAAQPFTGVDPGFEIGGDQNARVSTRKFFFSASLTFKSTTRFGHLWNCDTIITIGINKYELFDNYNFEALCGHCC